MKTLTCVALAIVIILSCSAAYSACTCIYGEQGEIISTCIFCFINEAPW